MVHLRTTRIDSGHFIIELRDVCRCCTGTGEDLQGCTCDVCQGSGVVLVTKDVKITVQPYKAQK